MDSLTPQGPDGKRSHHPGRTEPTPPPADPLDQGGEPPSPVALPVNLDGVPAELRRLPRWVVWSYYWDKDKRRWCKPPRNPVTLRFASCNDPTTWRSLDVAHSAYLRRRQSGLGFMLSCGPDDPLGLLVIDLDLPSLVEAIRPVLPTYAESSPTRGKGGAHVLCWGHKPPGLRNAKGVEVYSHNRYLTVTGQRLEGWPGGIFRPEPSRLASAFARLGLVADPRPVRPPQKPPPLRAGRAPADDEILRRAFEAANGQRVRELWLGDWSSYPSQSHADLCLCGRLAFWVGPDPARIDSLFRRSGLYREKWDTVRYRTGETYGQRTIATAIANSRSFYSWGGRR